MPDTHRRLVSGATSDDVQLQ